MSTDQQPSISALVKSATEDVSQLVNDQIALTKAELKDTADAAKTTVGLFGAAALFGLLTLIFALVTLAYGLVQLGMQTWAAFGVVALILLVITAIAGLVGKKRAEKIHGPERAIAELEKSRTLLGSPNGS